MVTAPAPPLMEPTAPGWAQRFALRIATVFKAKQPSAPEKLWAVLQADLPPATAWPGCQVYISDLQKVGLSNGTAWTDTTGGAL